MATTAISMTTSYNESSSYYYSLQRLNASQNTSEMTSEEGGEGGGAEPMSDGAKVIVTLMYSCVIIVAVGGNVIVCGIVITQKGMRTVTNYFLVSLAMSDIAMATLCIPFTFVANILVGYWPFGVTMCPIMLYSQTATVFLSAFTMVSISVDRFRAVMFPLKQKLTPRTTVIIILITWIVALTVPLPTAIQSRVVEKMGPDGVVRDFCNEEWVLSEQRYAYSLVVMILQYFVPLAFLAFTYASIGLVIWVKRVPGEAENNRDRRFAASKRKMVKMMVTVVVLYALCWLPIHVLTIVGDRHPEIWTFHHIQSVWVACHWLAMSNCCYNPIVYCWMNAKFRNGFCYVFRSCPFVHYDRLSHNGSMPCSKSSFIVQSYVSTCGTTKHGTGYPSTAGYNGSSRRNPSCVYAPACSTPNSRRGRCNGDLPLPRRQSGSCHTESYLLSPMGSEGRNESPYSNCSRHSDRDRSDKIHGNGSGDSSTFDYVDHFYKVPTLRHDSD